jgi:hypothetical protein
LAGYYFGMRVAALAPAVTIWLLRVAMFVLAELRAPAPHLGAQFWLVFVVLSGSTLPLLLGLLSSDAVLGSVTSWVLLLSTVWVARKPSIRLRHPWAPRPRTAWHLAAALLFGVGVYASVIGGLHCPDLAHDDKELDPPAMTWAGRLRGRSCRCAGDYTGPSGGHWRSVLDGGEACFCSEQWAFSSSVQVRARHGL